MIHRVPLLLFALASLAFALPAKAQSPVVVLSRDIPSLMQQTDIPGLSIALVQNGRTSWVRSFGTVDPSTGEPVTEHTRFSAASLSKTVFAYAVLQLVDQDKLDLDTPLTHYWPERVVDPADDARLDKITARIVLSHRTGFRNWRNDDKLKIYFTPGERFSYSGEGYVYLQHTIERIEGKPLNEIAQQLVFAPFGMTDSTYISVPGLNITLGYNAGGLQRTPIRSEKGDAAASLLTTAHDYALFLEAVFSGRGLKPATLRQMETPQVAVDPTCTNCTDHAPAKLSTELFWGLGWGIEQTSTGRYLWHWGDNGAFKAFVTVDLKHRNAVVFFANSSNGLAIAPVILRDAIGGEHPAFGWIKYDAYDSLNVRFIHDSLHNGASQALAAYASQIKDNSVSEETMNSAGYFLLRRKRYDDAIAIFNRCLELHPKSDNAYNNLGETFAETGKTELAIDNYRHALALKPGRDDTQAALAKLQSTGAKTEAAH